MDIKMWPTVVPQSKEATRPEKAPVLHVQTGVRAGGPMENFYNWWRDAAESFNEFDKATGAGG